MASHTHTLPHRALTDTGSNRKLKTFSILQGVYLVICSLIPDHINETHLEAAVYNWDKAWFSHIIFPLYTDCHFTLKGKVYFWLNLQNTKYRFSIVNIKTILNFLVVRSGTWMAIMHISALGGRILDGMGFVLFFSYHLKNDLCTLTYILWASINTRNVKVTDVGNIQDSSQKLFVSQMVSN